MIENNQRKLKNLWTNDILCSDIFEMVQLILRDGKLIAELPKENIKANLLHNLNNQLMIFAYLIINWRKTWYRSLLRILLIISLDSLSSSASSVSIVFNMESSSCTYSLTYMRNHSINWNWYYLWTKVLPSSTEMGHEWMTKHEDSYPPLQEHLQTWVL